MAAAVTVVEVGNESEHRMAGPEVDAKGQSATLGSFTRPAILCRLNELLLGHAELPGATSSHHAVGGRPA